MDKSTISLIISALALVISAGVAFFNVSRSVSQSRLDRERARSGLLTQAAELKIAYERYGDDLSFLLLTTKRDEAPEQVERLERMKSNVKGFIDSAQELYDQLLAKPGISHESIEQIRHKFEVWHARVKADREQLQQVREEISKVTDG